MKSCKEIVRIQASGETLTGLAQFEMKFHLLVCRACWRYTDHLRKMKRAFSSILERQTHAHQDQIHKIEEYLLSRYAK